MMTSRPVPESAAETPRTDDTTVALVFDHPPATRWGWRNAPRSTTSQWPATPRCASGCSRRIPVFGNPALYERPHRHPQRGREGHALGNRLGRGQERAEELQSRRRELETQNATATSAAGGISGAAMARNSSEIGARGRVTAGADRAEHAALVRESPRRDHRGYGTSAPCSASWNRCPCWPGRKTIVFFSEGLPVSPVLAAPRRGHRRGQSGERHLRHRRPRAACENGSDDFEKGDGRVRRGSLQSALVGSDRTNQPLTMAFERVEDTLNLDSHTGLAKLAEDTGGFLVEDSNDLSSAFKRIDEDNQFHYLLTYAPGMPRLTASSARSA